MSAAEKMTAGNLQKRMATESNLVLLDIMPEDRYNDVHIPGAVNACVYEVVFGDKAAGLIADKSTPVVVYDVRSETKGAEVAAEKLKRLGYTNISVLDGGLEAWCKAGNTIAGDKGDACLEKSSYNLADGNYTIDIDTSSITWAGRNANSRHYGSLKFASGSLTIQGGVVKGNCTVDMRSIQNDDLSDKELNAALLHHLSSDDFFYTEKYPTSAFTFQAESLPDAPAGAAGHVVAGDMHICGITAPLEFPAVILPHAEGGISAEAHFDLDRTKFGIIYGCARFFDFLGMHLVYENISLDVVIRAK